MSILSLVDSDIDSHGTTGAGLKYDQSENSTLISHFTEKISIENEFDSHDETSILLVRMHMPM